MKDASDALVPSEAAEWEDDRVNEKSERKLVGTGVAARALGVDRTTLVRWAAAGAVTPAVRTVGGHLRWDIEQLREQLDGLSVVRDLPAEH